jgi:ribosome-binding factor A
VARLEAAPDMQNRRHQRVNELLKRELSEILLREFSVSEAGLVTVNAVSVSNDLHSAMVYVGVVGSDEQRKRVDAVLREHRKRIQTQVGASVTLKYTPELRFVIDDSIARGQRVLAILDEIEKELPPEANQS